MEPGNLASVCGCQGTMEFVHEECIRKWHAVSGSTTCELCREPFRITFHDKEELSEDFCAIVFWMSLGSLLSFAHAFLIWRHVQHYPDDIGGVILLSVMVNSGYALVFALLKYYKLRFQFYALKVWISLFFVSSISLQLGAGGFGHASLYASYALTIASFAIFVAHTECFNTQHRV